MFSHPPIISDPAVIATQSLNGGKNRKPAEITLVVSYFVFFAVKILFRLLVNFALFGVNFSLL